MTETSCGIGNKHFEKEIKIKIFLLMLGCDDNTYGIKCASQCTCNAVNSASPCNKVNGTCNCRLGYDPRQNCGKGK